MSVATSDGRERMEGAALLATRREWVGLAVLTLASLVYAMDLTVLHLAVPRLSAALQPSSAQLLWIIDIYGFLVAGSLITMGTLGDRIGRRRLLLIGAVAFAAVSVLAAFSSSANMLIASRALMGIAGATIAPSTLSLIFNMFRDARQRSVAIGFWITSFSAGSAIGPMMGGILLEFFWWGSVFLIAVPVMALLLILGPRVLPEYRDPSAERLDLPSAAMSLAAVLAVIYGLKQTVQDGFGPVPAAAVVLGVLIGLLFIRRQRGLADPLIDVGLFRLPTFNVSLATNVLAIFVVVGYFLFVAQYLQLVLGLTPIQAGLWSLPSAAGFIIGTNLAPRFVHRVRPAYILTTSFLMAALGLGLLTQLTTSNGLAVVIPASLVISLALAPVFNLTTELIVGSAPPEKAGAASGISETGAELGGALGLAILGSIGTAVYRVEMAGRLPEDIPAHVRAAALDTLGGAVRAAEQLPDGLGEAIIEIARQSFVNGLILASGIGAIVALLSAVMAAVALWSVRGRDEPVATPSAQPERALAGGAPVEGFFEPPHSPE